MYTLVVVDMQPGFRTANRKRVRENCLREVQRAVKDNAHIIFLEFIGYQATHQELIKNLHDDVVFLEKYDDDGSRVIEREVRRNKRPTSFKVCGINTDCCVEATVRGLTARFPMSKIEVVTDACDSEMYHLSGLKRMRDMDNVKLI